MPNVHRVHRLRHKSPDRHNRKTAGGNGVGHYTSRDGVTYAQREEDAGQDDSRYDSGGQRHAQLAAEGLHDLPNPTEDELPVSERAWHPCVGWLRERATAPPRQSSARGGLPRQPPRLRSGARRGPPSPSGTSPPRSRPLLWWAATPAAADRRRGARRCGALAACSFWAIWWWNGMRGAGLGAVRPSSPSMGAMLGAMSRFCLLLGLLGALI